MALRAIWTGSIAFGLVNVPVRMYSAVEEHTLHFNYVHAPDGSRIGYEKICKAEDKPVPDDEIVKAFEYEKGEWVYMTDEDFEAAAAENHKTIDIRAFVPFEATIPSTSSAPITSGQRRTASECTRFSLARWTTRASPG
jgi:DNA end-binding protein Ku